LAKHPSSGNPQNREERRHHPDRRLWPLSEAAWQLGVTRKHLYTMIGRGEISSVTIGRRRFITADQLDSFVERLVQAAKADAS
jgi:excisionase family DNA binding protein